MPKGEEDGKSSKVYESWASQVVQSQRIHPPVQETLVGSLGPEDPLKKEMATHSSILAWEIHRQRNLVGSPCGLKESDTT